MGFSCCFTLSIVNLSLQSKTSRKASSTSPGIRAPGSSTTAKRGNTSGISTSGSSFGYGYHLDTALRGKLKPKLSIPFTSCHLAPSFRSVRSIYSVFLTRVFLDLDLGSHALDVGAGLGVMVASASEPAVVLPSSSQSMSYIFAPAPPAIIVWTSAVLVTDVSTFPTSVFNPAVSVQSPGLAGNISTFEPDVFAVLEHITTSACDMVTKPAFFKPAAYANCCAGATPVVRLFRRHASAGRAEPGKIEQDALPALVRSPEILSTSPLPFGTMAAAMSFASVDITPKALLMHVKRASVPSSPAEYIGPLLVTTLPGFGRHTGLDKMVSNLPEGLEEKVALPSRPLRLALNLANFKARALESQKAALLAPAARAARPRAPLPHE
mmetsp:Transcript_149382/g.260475  ORF Transcript_149382/g.260475 Transcript_149382/m.260475 type:complete len:381 (+) Transcript_149382:1424-2566(+)